MDYSATPSPQIPRKSPAESFRTIRLAEGNSTGNFREHAVAAPRRTYDNPANNGFSVHQNVHGRERQLLSRRQTPGRHLAKESAAWQNGNLT